MEKNKAKECILMTCISFTAVNLILSVVNLALKGSINEIGNLQLFTCCALISVLVYITDRLPGLSQAGSYVLSFIDVAVVIFGVGGGIFHWFHWNLADILLTAVILTTVYGITSLVLFWQDAEVAKKINRIIEENEHE